jgi:hypothetical protein
MRKTLSITRIALRAGATLLLLTTPTWAQDANPDRPPVKRVIVYDTGVAFIEHEGKVSGDKELLLDLPDRDVNDLLKSMVVKDLGGGRVSWAAMPTSTKKEAPIPLVERRSLPEMLLALRGMHVRIGAAAPMEGVLLLVESRTLQESREVIPQVTLLTESGVVRVDVKNGEAVQVTDQSKRKAVARSTELLDSTLDLSATRIRLKCEGEGDREVRVGYVAAMPIWKASYRLVLREDGKSLLQAWALIENDTQTDWKDIECTLVSGRGLGFQTDLRTPLNIKRPYRAPERFSAIAPEIHDSAERMLEDDPDNVSTRHTDDPTDSLAFAKRKGSMGMGMGGMGGMAGPDEFLGTPTEMNEMLNRRLERWREESSKATSSIAQSAQSGVLDSSSTLGESIRYRLKGGVSLARGETALLHLLDAELEGREIALFNPSIDGAHPLHAAYVANTTGGALAAGPISIFSGDSYRGDAIVDHWQSGEKRVLGYALDTRISVTWKSEETPLEYLGVLVTEEDELVFVTRESLKGQYVVENHSDAKRTVWIEHPRFKDWTLSAPEKAVETTNDRYRLEREVDANKKATVEVALSRYRLLWPEAVEERLTKKQIADMAVFTAGVRKALSMPAEKQVTERKVFDRRNEILERERELVEDQDRIRKTLSALEKYPEQAKPFIDKLIQSEKTLEELEKERKAIAIKDDQDNSTQIVDSIEKEYKDNWAKILLQIRAENPFDKLPYKPTAKEIEEWRERQSTSMQGFGGMGGGMGGMGGGFF